MIEAAKCMFLKLLGESRERLHIEITRNKHQYSRPETPSEKSVWKTPIDGTPVLVPIPPSLPDRSGICAVKLEPVSKTQPSRESLEQVVDGVFSQAT